MEIALFILGVVGAILGIGSFWVQRNSYLLQKAQGSGPPGRRLDPREADRILDDIWEDPVRAIAAAHIFVESEKKGVGYIERLDIGVYLDLHTASCDPGERAVLAESLAKFVQETIGSQQLRGVSLAAPREGNVLVGSGAAMCLDLDFLMIRTGRAPRFGFPIEGCFSTGSDVILIDDLCMEASFLSRCVKLLRRYGLNVSHCICLFERLDGNAREGLAEVSVELHSKYQIDDEELTRLKDAGVSALLAGEAQEEQEETEQI